MHQGYSMQIPEHTVRELVGPSGWFLPCIPRDHGVCSLQEDYCTCEDSHCVGVIYSILQSGIDGGFWPTQALGLFGFDGSAMRHTKEHNFQWLCVEHIDTWLAAERKRDAELMRKGRTKAGIGKVCPVCHQAARKVCSRCKQVWYCGKEHQKEHWRLHKHACSIHDVAAAPAPAPAEEAYAAAAREAERVQLEEEAFNPITGGNRRLKREYLQRFGDPLFLDD